MNLVVQERPINSLIILDLGNVIDEFKSKFVALDAIYKNGEAKRLFNYCGV